MVQVVLVCSLTAFMIATLPSLARRKTVFQVSRRWLCFSFSHRTRRRPGPSIHGFTASSRPSAKADAECTPGQRPALAGGKPGSSFSSPARAFQPDCSRMRAHLDLIDAYVLEVPDRRTESCGAATRRPQRALRSSNLGGGLSVDAFDGSRRRVEVARLHGHGVGIGGPSIRASRPGTTT